MDRRERDTFPTGSMRTNRDELRIRRERRLTWGLMLPVLLVCIGLQFIVVAILPQSFLATLISLYKAPAVASYPYMADMSVSLSSSPNMLYAGTVPDSYVLRASDGTVVQRVPDRIFASYQGMLFTSSFSNDSQGSTLQVKAIRQSDGSLLWSDSEANFQVGELIDGVIYLTRSVAAQQATGLLLALNPANGHVIWQYQCATSQCYVTSPLVSNGVAYTEVQGSSWGVVALRANDGKLVWQISLSQYAIQPVIAGDRLLVQTSYDTITAYRATDGHFLWVKRLESANNQLLQSSSNGNIGLIHSTTTLYALRLDTGDVLWQRKDVPFPYDAESNTSSVYLTTSGTLTALDIATGKQLWQQTKLSPIKNTLRVSIRDQHATILGEFNGLIYTYIQMRNSATGLATTTISAFRVVDGQQAWQYSMQAPVGAFPSTLSSDIATTLNNGVVYVSYNQAATDVGYIHFTIAVSSAFSSPFRTTTFTLTSLAIDAQSGKVTWHNQQVEKFPVA